jgi:hypothetical protein
LFRSAGLDLNFAGGVFSLNNTRTDSPANIPGWSFSRTDTGIATALDLAGNVIQFPSRTNRLLYSQELDNAAWTKVLGVTVSANADTAPDGSTTADLVTFTTTNGNRIEQDSGVAAVDGVTWTGSIWLKGSGTISIATSTTTGVGGSTEPTITLTSTWTRYTATVTLAGGATGNVRFMIIWRTGRTATEVTTWGAQLETGSTATAYIPTTTAAVTVVLPRITNRGILVEEARTNLFERSYEFDNAYWSKTNVTVTAGLTAPDGTATAQRLQATTTAGTNCVRAVTVNATSATYSIFAKKGSGATDANLFALRNSTTATILVAGSINYDTGVWTYSTGSTGVTVTTLANGWYWIAMSATSGITSGNSIQGYVFFLGGTETAGENALAWGAQMEAGAFATSPIITTGAAGTRGADLPSIANSAIPSFPFTLLADYGVTGTAQAALGRIVDWGGGNVNTQVLSYRNNTSQTSVQIGNTANIFPSGRLGIRVQPGTSAASGGGSSVLTFSDVITREAGPMYIGNRQSEGRATNDYIQRIRVLPFAAIDAQLQALTAP